MSQTPFRTVASMVAGFGQSIRSWPATRRAWPRMVHYFLCWLAVSTSCQLKGQIQFYQTWTSHIQRWDIDKDGIDDLALHRETTQTRDQFPLSPIEWDSTRITLQFLKGTDGFLTSLQLGRDWSTGEPVGRQWVSGCLSPSPELLYYSTNIFGQISVRGTNIVYRFSDTNVQEFVSGFQMELADGIHYGWVRVRPQGPLELDQNQLPIVSDRSFRVDYALHPSPSEPILLGVPPTPGPILSEGSVREFQIFGSSCERFLLRTRRVVKPDESVSVIRTIEAQEVLSKATSSPDSDLSWEAVPWPNRTRIPSGSQGDQQWKDARAGVLLLEEQLDRTGNKTSSFGPLSNGKAVFLGLRGFQTQTPTWALINPAMNCLAKGKGVTGSPAPPEVFDERYLDIDSDGLLDVTVASTIVPGYCPDTVTKAYPIGDYQILGPTLRGVKIDGSLRQFQPTGQTLSTVSCDFFYNYPDWQFTFFGLVKDAPDGRHYGWLQIIPAEIPITRLWFEEQPETPALAGRYPPPELRIRAVSSASRPLLEFTVLNGREYYELQAKIGIGNATWRTILKDVPSKFTLPIQAPNQQVYRLLSY